MLPCEGCGYRRDIPGSCHFACAFDWVGAKMVSKLPLCQSSERVRRQWYNFPLNYDPCWGPDECAARAEEADESKTIANTPLVSMLSVLLGAR